MAARIVRLSPFWRTLAWGWRSSGAGVSGPGGAVGGGIGGDVVSVLAVFVSDLRRASRSEEDVARAGGGGGAGSSLDASEDLGLGVAVVSEVAVSGFFERSAACVALDASNVREFRECGDGLAILACKRDVGHSCPLREAL